MKGKKFRRVINMIVSLVLCFGLVLLLVGCDSESGTEEKEPARIVVKNAEDAIDQLAKLEGDSYANAYSELTEKNSNSVGGDSYYRLQQNYQGIPVYGRTVICVTDEKGNIIDLAGNALDVEETIDLTPALTQAQAQKSIDAYATETLGQESVEGFVVGELTEDMLCIYNLDVPEARLAYCINTGGYEFVVDAQNGAVIFAKIPLNEETGYWVTDTEDGGFCIELNEEGFYQLKNSAIGVSMWNLNGKSSANIDNIRSSTPVVSKDTIFGNDPSEREYEDAITLYKNLTKLAEIFEDKCSYKCEQIFAFFNDGYDLGLNARGGMLSDENGQFVGAIYVGQKVGGNDIDVLAHEFTHVMSREIVDWTGASIQNKALNEGISDLFGELVEAWYFEEIPDWIMLGDNIFVKRNIADPEATNNADEVGDSSWLVSEKTDQYFHSTIISHSAYLMWHGIDGNGSKKLSADELAELWYRAMLMMPSNCNFAECRMLVERAAQTMDTLTDEQRACVSEAFDMVGIPSLENPMEVEYSLSNNSTISVLDKNGDLYSGYTLQIRGKLAGGETTVSNEERKQFSTVEQLAGLGEKTYEKTYSVDSAEPFSLQLENGLYTITVSDRYSKTEYVMSALVTAEGTDKSITLATDFQTPLVVEITDPDWKQLYYDFIIQDRRDSDSVKDWETVTYQLIYLDDDTIPELWIDYCIYADGCSIATISNGKVCSTGLTYGEISYLESQNIFCYSNGHQGAYGDTIYKLENGSLIEVAGGSYDTYTMKYIWDGQVVSEQVYTGNVDEYVDPSVARSTSDGQNKRYSYDEILEFLHPNTADGSTTMEAKALLEAYLDSGAYKELFDSELLNSTFGTEVTGYDREYCYTIADLNADGVPEMLINVGDGTGFYFTWVLAVDGEEVVMVYEYYGFNTFSYSPGQNAVILSSPTRPNSYFDGYDFCQLVDGEFKFLYTVGMNEGQWFYWDSSMEESKPISVEGKDSYYADREWFDWQPIDERQTANTQAKVVTFVAVYDKTGKLSQTNTVTYDEKGRVISVHSQRYGDYASESTLEYAYDENGNILYRKTGDPGHGYGTSYEYNEAGQLIYSFSWEGGASENYYEYDSSGRLNKMTSKYATGSDITKYSYDKDGKCVSTVTTHTEAYDEFTSEEKTTYTYDSQGRLSKTVTEASGFLISDVYEYPCEGFETDKYYINEKLSSVSGYVLDPYGNHTVSFYLDEPEYIVDESGYLVKIVDTDRTYELTYSMIDVNS